MKSIKDRNELIEQHIGFAERLANKRYSTVNKTVQYGELLSAAYYGLLDAAERFDRSKVHDDAKYPFESYARPRIVGEMNDYLRSCNWGTRKNPQTMLSLNSPLFNSPTSNYDNGERTLNDICSTDLLEPPSVVNKNELFDKIIRSLSKRERRIFILRYYYRLTMKEIAECVGVCESRVSQIFAKSVAHLKEVWGNRKDELWHEI